MEIIYLIIGLLIGAVVSYLFVKNKSENQTGKAEERNRIYEENNKQLNSELN